MAEGPAKVDYGLDSPALIRNWWHRAGWSLGIGLAVWYINHQEYPGPAARVFTVLILAAAVCAGLAVCKIRYSREGKLRFRDRLLDQLDLRGDEKLLDVGCGRGIMAIGAAQRLKTGKVTAIDTWNPRELSGNSAEAAKENAKAAGVADRVRFEPGHSSKLVYPANQFDVVMSMNGLHGLDDDNQRKQSLAEILRVLKPGGRLLLFDSAETGYYAEILRSAGARDVTLSAWGFEGCRPARSLTARK